MSIALYVLASTTLILLAIFVVLALVADELLLKDDPKWRRWEE